MVGPNPATGRAPGPPPPEYRVRFCNQTQADDVWIIVGYTGAGQTYTEGYWTVSRGECTTVNFSQLMLTTGLGRPDQPPRTFYRAFTYGEDSQIWGGLREREDPVLCVNTVRKFRENQMIRRDDGEYEFNPCDGEDEAQMRFRWGPVFDPEVQTALINF
ncbi:MAG: DUF1036 domain-containing protein [Pseudomonadota bacterium]